MVVQPRCCARVGRRQVYGPRSPQGGRGPLISRGRYRPQPIEARAQLILSRPRASPRRRQACSRLCSVRLLASRPWVCLPAARRGLMPAGTIACHRVRLIGFGGTALARRCQARLASPRAPAPKRGGLGAAGRFVIFESWLRRPSVRRVDARPSCDGRAIQVRSASSPRVTCESGVCMRRCSI